MTTYDEMKKFAAGEPQSTFVGCPTGGSKMKKVTAVMVKKYTAVIRVQDEVNTVIHFESEATEGKFHKDVAKAFFDDTSDMRIPCDDDEEGSIEDFEGWYENLVSDEIQIIAIFEGHLNTVEMN